eukprot:COSAG01_NODE_47021_length_394_cov_1.501695_1_plen_55_part_10
MVSQWTVRRVGACQYPNVFACVILDREGATSHGIHAPPSIDGSVLSQWLSMRGSS